MEVHNLIHAKKFWSVDQCIVTLFASSVNVLNKYVPPRILFILLSFKNF